MRTAMVSSTTKLTQLKKDLMDNGIIESTETYSVVISTYVISTWKEKEREDFVDCYCNLVIIHWETRLYQSGALIPLGPSKITMITAGLKGDRGTKGEMSRSKYIGYGEDRNQGSRSIFLTAI